MKIKHKLGGEEEEEEEEDPLTFLFHALLFRDVLLKVY